MIKTNKYGQIDINSDLSCLKDKKIVRFEYINDRDTIGEYIVLELDDGTVFELDGEWGNGVTIFVVNQPREKE